MLLLLQIFTGDLNTIVFDITYKIDNLLLPSLFFGSFIFISIFLLALLGGLIWEVFTIVEDIWREEREWESKQLDKLEREEQKKKLMTSKSRNYTKKRKSMSLDQNVSLLVDKQQKNYEPNHNFVLDLLQDDDHQDIQFTDSDMFDLNDKSPYSEGLPQMLSDVIKEESHSDYIEEEKQMNIQDSIAVKQVDLMERYNFDEKYEKNTRLLSSTMPFSTNVEMQMKKKSPQSSQSPVNILVEHFMVKFSSCTAFFSRQQNLKTEGIFEANERSLNSFYVSQIKEDLKSFEEENKQETIKDINIQNNQFLIENAILKGANQKEIRKQELNHFYEKFGH